MNERTKKWNEKKRNFYKHSIFDFVYRNAMHELHLTFFCVCVCAVGDQETGSIDKRIARFGEEEKTGKSSTNLPYVSNQLFYIFVNFLVYERILFYSVCGFQCCCYVCVSFFKFLLTIAILVMWHCDLFHHQIFRIRAKWCKFSI